MSPIFPIHEEILLLYLWEVLFFLDRDNYGEKDFQDGKQGGGREIFLELFF